MALPTITIPRGGHEHALKNPEPVQNKITNNSYSSVKKQKSSIHKNNYETRFKSHQAPKTPTNNSVSKTNNLLSGGNHKKNTAINVQPPSTIFSLSSSPFIAHLLGQTKHHSTTKTSFSATEAYNRSQNLSELYFYRIEPIRLVV